MSEAPGSNKKKLERGREGAGRQSWGRGTDWGWKDRSLESGKPYNTWEERDRPSTGVCGGSLSSHVVRCGLMWNP